MGDELALSAVWAGSGAGAAERAPRVTGDTALPCSPSSSRSCSAGDDLVPRLGVAPRLPAPRAAPAGDLGDAAVCRVRTGDLAARLTIPVGRELDRKWRGENGWKAPPKPRALPAARPRIPTRALLATRSHALRVPQHATPCACRQRLPRRGRSIFMPVVVHHVQHNEADAIVGSDQ